MVPKSPKPVKVMWVTVGISKSICLGQVSPRLEPLGAKLCKPSHSGFLQKWWFLHRSSASHEKACPILAQGTTGH